jgi:hypothetical protein
MKIYTFLFLTFLVVTGSKLSSVISLASHANDLDHFSNSLRDKQLSEGINLQTVLSTIFTQMQTKNTDQIKEELSAFFKKIDDSITQINKEYINFNTVLRIIINFVHKSLRIIVENVAKILMK